MSPVLKAQLQLHKSDIPSCPVVNNINAPTYKIAKFLTKELKEYLALNNEYTVMNSANLAYDQMKPKINSNF
jgi:hypothetical protein